MAVHPGSDKRCPDHLGAARLCGGEGRRPVGCGAVDRDGLDLDAHLLGDRRHLHQREILRRRAHFVRLGDLREAKLLCQRDRADRVALSGQVEDVRSVGVRLH